MATRLIAFAVLPLAAALSISAQFPKSVREFGTVQNNVYHHHATGVEFTLPEGWHIVSQGYEDGGQAVTMRDSVTQAFARVWMKTVITQQVDDIAGLLDRRLDDKGLQRNTYQDYRFRKDSVQHMTVNGNQGLSVVADFVNLGEKKAEYHTWVYTAKTHVYFNARVPEAQLPAVQSRFDGLIQSTVVP
jgi:hypothetical protein